MCESKISLQEAVFAKRDTQKSVIFVVVELSLCVKSKFEVPGLTHHEELLLQCPTGGARSVWYIERHSCVYLRGIAIPRQVRSPNICSHNQVTMKCDDGRPRFYSGLYSNQNVFLVCSTSYSCWYHTRTYRIFVVCRLTSCKLRAGV